MVTNCDPTDPDMIEIWERKERLSLRYNSQTPEENRQDTERAFRRIEKIMGKPIASVDPETVARREQLQV